ncbi:BlaR1 peptidase M56 [Kordia periserrulae]|uniref:BlaR1 peptidase M56 n=1 Tax=Kordia periserrulae TaxID=701523 RepID=A0A2T6BZF0_9FLAO|nr:peptidoglycan DD-metalloendopeptidase family protein [Kordia periserrulae]PTX61451.1 BlaR1 peptidase M56 [Kordia periserrulae]
MNSFLIYLFQVSLVFSGFYLLFKCIFSRFTFHAFNRIFLVSMIPLSLLLPLSDTLFSTLQIPIELPILKEVTEFTESFTLTSVETTNHQTVAIGFWMFSMYLVLFVSFLIRFTRTIFCLIRLQSKATQIMLHDTKVYATNVSEVFSYFHWVFVPKTTVATIEKCILTHEKAHISKLHSIDMILTELFIAFQWFNPLAYFYRKSLKSIHEFQADAAVLTKENIKKSSYLTLLLTSLQPTKVNPAYNYFSQSTLKKRIDMMTKSPSKNHSKLAYVLLLPVIALTFMAFKNSGKSTILNELIPVAINESGVPSLFPVKNKTVDHISSEFGAVRKHPKLKDKIPHGGIDIKASLGTPIVATADGTVIKAKDEGNWGNLIIISHSDGFETLYAHLQGFNITAGQTVKKGDIIGYVGNSGLSTAPHLHYEVRQNGMRLNPLKYITE